MYQALYRKWRPKTFEDVVGQKHVTDTLASEIESGRISHAYLFIGSRGTGKTSCAKIFAKAVNCLSPVNGNPCGKCEICKEIENDSIIDIVEIDAASNNGVENIRSMRDEVVFAPAKCKYRVYIVDEVHMLSIGAFNAFLKVLEEPPKHVIFILATTEIHKIPATIISRCQKFNFYRISENDIIKKINEICKKEKIKIDAQSAKLIAKSADGGMRDALSVLDQCANSCDNNITFEKTSQIIGVTPQNQVEEFAKNIIGGNCSECIEIIEKVHNQAMSMVKFCETSLEYFRSIMIDVVNNRNKGVSLSRILQILDVFQTAFQNINGGAKPKLEMEIAVVRLCEKTNPKPEASVTPDTSSKVDPAKYMPDAPTAKTQKLPDFENLKSNDNIFGDWEKVLSELKNIKGLRSLYTSLKDSTAYTSENHILIDSKNSMAFELLRNNSEYKIAIKNIIKNITGRQYGLGPYKLNTTAQKSPESPTSDPFERLTEKAQKNGINVILD